MKQDWPDQAPDWADTHTGTLKDVGLTAHQAYDLAFSTMPKWVDVAMAVRNRIVRIFGLQTEGEDTNRPLMTSLPILQDNPNVYEVGLIDKHLTFTLRTQRSGDYISLTTSIWYQHWLGRVYLAIVLIPHKIIVKQTLKRLA